jgi:CubicO group peptidase (beta-lactamase class C family)
MLEFDRAASALAGGTVPGTDEDRDVRLITARTLARWPSAGIAIAIVRQGDPERFFVHGVTDVRSGGPVTKDTVFRIASLTKTVTAVAVMQLCEQGLVDLDAAANDYLRAFTLVPSAPGLGPATVRHLLTHTAGVGYWRRRSDLFHPALGSGIAARSIVPLADYYHDGLPVDVEPGTRWAYSNHGFATLGQIVEDVSGEPFGRYLRAHVLAPLGMEDTDFVLSDRMGANLATGHLLRSHGLRPVQHREIPLAGGGGLYSTARDMARYLAALLGDGANEHGRVLAPVTVASMFRSHFQPDPRVAGMGLGFEPREENGTRIVGKAGTVAGFLSAFQMVPAEQLGVVVLTNTGGLDNRGTAEPLASALVRRLAGLPDDPVRDDIAPRVDAWADLCGWYAPDAGPVTNLFLRVMMGAGVEVVVRDGRLLLKPLTPVPALRAGMVLHPDDPDDPLVFRVEVPGYGRSDRVVFTGGTTPRLFLDVMSFEKRPDVRNPRRWLGGAVAATAAAATIAWATTRRRALR